MTCVAAVVVVVSIVGELHSNYFFPGVSFDVFSIPIYQLML